MRPGPLTIVAVALAATLAVASAGCSLAPAGAVPVHAYWPGWRLALAPGEDPRVIVNDLLGRIAAEAKTMFPAWNAFMDTASQSVKISVIVPESSGKRVYRASITLYLSSLTPTSEGTWILSIAPRMSTDVVKVVDGMEWLADDAEDDLVRLTENIQDVLRMVDTRTESRATNNNELVSP